MSTGGDKNYERSRGLVLDWFTIHQQRHIVAHRMPCLTTMTVLAERPEYSNVQLFTWHLRCGGCPETAQDN